MQNTFCTLAIGGQHAEFARYLAADLGVYKVPFVVVTDVPEAFRSFSHAHVVEHRPKQFSYHDKRIALREALKLGDTAIFVDADTAIWFGADRRVVHKAVTYSFPPGLHAGKLSPEDIYTFPHIENLAREWGLKFNRNVISYWEGLFALTKHDALDEFFAIWDRFAEEARERGYNGAGEGACFGIAAEASGLQRHYTTHMMQSMLPYMLWHTRLGFNRRRLYHLKFGIKEMFSGNINVHQHCWAY
jgi:hypothetical protein